MKRLLLGFLMLLPVISVLADETTETPLYTALAEVAEAEGYGETLFPPTKNIVADVYKDYVILHAFAGAEGYDLKVGIVDETITSLTPIKNGVEGTTVKSGYCNVSTGVEALGTFQPYLSADYCFGGLYDDESGYVCLWGYIGSEFTYYYCAWPQDDSLYTSTGSVSETEGWGATSVPYIDEVEVVAYEDCVVIYGFAGVEGYDLKVGYGENDAVTYVASIVNGEEGEQITSGYADIPTGLDDVTSMRIYLAAKYCYAGLYEEESGYVLLSCYWGDDWTYYYCSWPKSDEPDVWVNPFLGEATLLYSAVGYTTTTSGDEDSEADNEGWGQTIFPEVKGINIDVYDKYIYIKEIAGVEGYGAKVAYNADSEVPSIMPVLNGVDGEPCKDYTYLETGIKAIDTIQAYPAYSYAQSYEDKSGYVLLAAYLYGEGDLAEWNYYYLVWDQDSSSISSITATEGTPVYFDLKGIAVDKPANGGVYIRVLNGKATKVIVK